MGLPIMNKLKKDDSGGKNLGSSFTGPDYKYQDLDDEETLKVLTKLIIEYHSNI